MSDVLDDDIEAKLNEVVRYIATQQPKGMLTSLLVQKLDGRNVAVCFAFDEEATALVTMMLDYPSSADPHDHPKARA